MLRQTGVMGGDASSPVARYWPRVLMWGSAALLVWLGALADQWWPEVVTFADSPCADTPGCDPTRKPAELDRIGLQFASVLAVLIASVIAAGLTLPRHRTILVQRTAMAKSAVGIAATLGLVFGVLGVAAVVFGASHSGFTMAAVVIVVVLAAAQCGELLLLRVGGGPRAAYGLAFATTGLTFTGGLLAGIVANIAGFIVAPLACAGLAAWGTAQSVRRLRGNPASVRWPLVLVVWVLPIVGGAMALTMAWRSARNSG